MNNWMANLFHCLLIQYYHKIWKNVKMVTLKFLDDCTDLLLFFKADYFLLCCAVLYWAVSQSCPILCDPMDCSLPGSPVHGILQARTLEWIAMLSSRGSSQPRDRTQVSHVAGGFFTDWATKYSLFSST